MRCSWRMRLTVFLMVAFPWHGALAAAPAVQLPQTGAFTCYDGAGSEIACSGTGQDGDLRNGVTWPDPRFTDNGNGTVTDNLTGLVWTRNARVPGPPGQCAPGVTKQWKEALEYVACLNANTYLGATDWRLPNTVEMESLLDASRSHPPLPLGHPFQNVVVVSETGDDNKFWTSTTHPGAPNSALFVSMETGRTETQFKEWHFYAVWPVRGGGGGTVQLPASGQTSCYHTTTHAPIPCAGTGQDGQDRRGVAWPSPRFTDNNNQTVTDTLTGLVWPRQDIHSTTFPECTRPQYLSWQGALDLLACFNANSYLGFSDWRMPNVREFATLVSRDAPNSAAALVNHGFFTSFLAISYWTSTTENNNQSFTSARIVNMDSGNISSLGKSVADTVGFFPVRGNIMPPPPPPVFSAGPTSYDFGTVMTGTSNPHQFSISNTAAPGSSSLRISSLAITGNGSSAYSLAYTGNYAPCGSATPVITPGNTCTFTVTSSPGQAGTFNAQVSIGTNVPGQSVIALPLTVNAVPPAELSVQVTGTGSGTVTSTPSGISCTSGTCTGTFLTGATVNLSATPTFSTLAWSGSCTGSGPCSVAMNGNRAVTATFTALPAKVSILGVSTPYYLIGAALDAIASADRTVRAKEEVFGENILMDTPYPIRLKGGYTDNAFGTRTATSRTIIDGSLKISRGKLMVERVALR